MSVRLPDALLIRAAELRASGAGWSVVAQTVGRTVDVVRRWPMRYPDRWAVHLRAAERRQAADAAAEGLHVLRRQLRSDDDKTARDAAAKLLDFKLAADKLVGPPAETDAARSQFHRLADHLETLSDDQIRRLLDDCVRHWLTDHSVYPGSECSTSDDRPEPVSDDLSDRPTGGHASAGNSPPGVASLPEQSPEGRDRTAA